MPQFDIQSQSGNLLAVPSERRRLATTEKPFHRRQIPHYTVAIFTSIRATCSPSTTRRDRCPTTSADLIWGQADQITNNACLLEIHFDGQLYWPEQRGGIEVTWTPSGAFCSGPAPTIPPVITIWEQITFYGVIYMPNAYLQIYNSPRT